MKKTIFRISALVMLGMFAYVQFGYAEAYTCRTEKLECKEGMKSDGDYTSEERAICRQVKLSCLAGPAQ